MLRGGGRLGLRCAGGGGGPQAPGRGRMGSSVLAEAGEVGQGPPLLCNKVKPPGSCPPHHGGQDQALVSKPLLWLPSGDQNGREWNGWEKGRLWLSSRATGSKCWEVGGDGALELAVWGSSLHGKVTLRPQVWS